MEPSNLLSAIKSFVNTCPFLSDIDIHIDRVDEEPVSYAIASSGLILQSEDVTGCQTWQYNAILQSREYTADDISRLDANAFTEKFVFWVSEQNVSGFTIELPSGMSFVSISADNGMVLFIDDSGDRGIYQVQLHLIFEKGG